MKSKKLIKTVRDLVDQADSKLSAADYINQCVEKGIFDNEEVQQRLDKMIIEAENLLHSALGICILLKGQNNER